MYEIIQDDQRLGVVFLESPKDLSTILEIADASGKSLPSVCDEPIPCNKIIRLTGSPPDVSIEEISGSQLVNIGKKVDINLAGEADLRAIPGVGPVLAQRIIAHRTSTGGFKGLEELRQVRGIGEKKLANLIRYLELSTEVSGRRQHLQPGGRFSDPSRGIHE